MPCECLCAYIIRVFPAELAVQNVVDFFASTYHELVDTYYLLRDVHTAVFKGFVVPCAFFLRDSTRLPFMCTYLYIRVFPGQISERFLVVALRVSMCLHHPRFSCGTFGAKCSCLPDFSWTSLQVPFTNWWHNF